MNEFQFGFMLGSLIVFMIMGSIIVKMFPSWFHLRQYQKNIENRIKNTEPNIQIDPKVVKILKQAEDILETHNIKV